jgi:arylsulfatase
MAPVAFEESGVKGIASRHGYKVESLDLSLFDIQADPGEKRNLATEHPEIVASLQTIASEFRNDLGDSIKKQIGIGIRSVGRE